MGSQRRICSAVPARIGWRMDVLGPWGLQGGGEQEIMAKDPSSPAHQPLQHRREAVSIQDTTPPLAQFPQKFIVYMEVIINVEQLCSQNRDNFSLVYKQMTTNYLKVPLVSGCNGRGRSKNCSWV